MSLDVCVSVPGKMMLAGEYAVLRGGQSLAVTTGCRLQVRGQRILGDRVVVFSELWDGPYDIEKEPNSIQDLVHHCLQSLKRSYPLRGFRFDIGSTIAVQNGFGSSSALRLGLVAAVDGLCRGDGEVDRWALAEMAYKVQMEHQSFASGYDVATQTVGGLVKIKPSARRWPGALSRRDVPRGLNAYFHIFAGGDGAPTKTTAGSTMKWCNERDIWATIRRLSGVLVDRVEGLLVSEDPPAEMVKEVARSVGDFRRVFEMSPKFPRKLDAALSGLPGFDTSWSYKTTGSGGEDAIIVVCLPDELAPVEKALNLIGWSKIDPQFSNGGLSIELS